MESSRRGLLKTLGVLGAGVMSTAASNNVKARRIDVHHHMLPPFQPNMADRHWTPQVALDSMDKFGTETAMLSLTVAGDMLYDGTEKARTFARRTNEYGAKIVSGNPKRFGLFAAIPVPDQDGSEFDFDTTRAITSLLYNGVLSRLPDLRVIVNHSGAAVPVLSGRIKDRVPGASSNEGGKSTPTEGKSAKTPNGVFPELRKLYYECAHATYPAPLAALQAFAPPTQYLFGSDFPIEPYETTVVQLPSAKLSAEVRRAMDRGNAERLFPRLKG